MRKFISLSFFLLLVYPSTFAQTQGLILTVEQNNQWLDSLTNSSLDKQLLMMRDRLLADTNVYVRQIYADRMIVTDSLGDRVYGDGKPTLIAGGYPMTIDNKTETAKIRGLTTLLTKEYIKNINILNPNDPKTTAIYGSPGKFGIIIMNLTKAKYAKQFKKLKLKPNY